MIVRQFERPQEFLSATEDFRAAHAALTNIIGSVAGSVADGGAYADEYWYTVDDGPHVVGCAMRTPPWLLAVSPMPSGAARALADLVAEVDPEVPGIVGPRDVAEAIASRLGRAGHVTMDELVRVLGRYVAPSGIPGRARPAVAADLDLVLAWSLQFLIDVGLPIRDEESMPEQLLEKFADESLLLWSVGDDIVAMAGHARLVTTPRGTVGRIGPVYTPADLRGRGYGSAITAAVVEHLQPRCDVLMLFTDAANPTSNGIYERLGFEVVGEIVEFEFDSPAQDAS